MSGYYNRKNRGITKKLGPVTAYADAVLAGYKGTREQWAQDMAKLGQNVTQVAQNTKLTTELAEQTRVNTEQVAKDTADVRELAEETSDNAAQVASNTEESNRLAKETKQAAAQAKADAEYAGAAADNFRVDTTLSEEGKAAEAKTTGEKFAQLSEDISDETKNRQNAVAQEIAARNTAITQERNRAVARENEIEGLFTMPTQEAVSEWLDEHPEATTTVQDASLDVEKFTDDAKKHVVKDYVTPQMFGAKADGVTDDTDALNAMIQHIESLLPLTNFNVDGGAECLDWRTINVEFHGCFAISDTVSFRHSINLVIDHLNLVALPDFLVGKPMLKFGVARNFSLSNCNIDCAHNSDVALRFDDYTIGSSMTNTYIHGFRKIGIECVNVGYEIKFNNIKIEQQTWEERQNNEIPADGIGIYLSERQQDHKFCNVIINYCAEYGFKVLSGANFFVNVHVWGCGNLFQGRYNFFENCYFSETVKIGGYFTFSNTYFAFEKDVPIIEGVENGENSWTYGYSKITDSVFTSTVNITNLFKNIRADERPYMVGNTFQNVPVIVNKGVRAVYGNPYSPTIEKTFDTDDVKSINIGNMVVFYGIAETSKTVNFAYALEEVYFSSASGRASGVTAQIWTDNLTAEIYTTGTCQWFVVGRIGG